MDNLRLLIPKAAGVGTMLKSVAGALGSQTLAMDRRAAAMEREEHAVAHFPGQHEQAEDVAEGFAPDDAAELRARIVELETAAIDANQRAVCAEERLGEALAAAANSERRLHLKAIGLNTELTDAQAALVAATTLAESAKAHVSELEDHLRDTLASVADVQERAARLETLLADSEARAGEAENRSKTSEVQLGDALAGWRSASERISGLEGQLATALTAAQETDRRFRLQAAAAERRLNQERTEAAVALARATSRAGNAESRLAETRAAVAELERQIRRQGEAAQVLSSEVAELREVRTLNQVEAERGTAAMQRIEAQLEASRGLAAHLFEALPDEMGAIGQFAPATGLTRRIWARLRRQNSQLRSDPSSANSLAARFAERPSGHIIPSPR